MPRLRSRNRRTDGLQIPHLSDQNHIRIFSKCRAQRIRIRIGVNPDLSLVDNREMVPVGKFDRILQRQDMLLQVVVDQIDDRSKRRRFTASGRPGHQDQSSGMLVKINDRIRNAQALRRRHLSRHHTEDNGNRSSLPEQIYAEPARSRDRISHIKLAAARKYLFLPLIHDLQAHSLRIFRKQALKPR